MKQAEPPLFPDFWTLWAPHKRKTDGRKLARETFAKHVRSGADPEDIVYGAAWFLRTMKERDREFIPLSSTWMNRGSYEDDCILERQRMEKLADIEARSVQYPKPNNVVHVASSRPSEAERAAHVAKLTGRAG